MPESLDLGRTFDATLINGFVNDPTIRPFVGGDGTSPLDLSAAIANIDNYFVSGRYGAFAFSWSAPDVYEIHTFILPEGRGEWSRRFALAARDYMQTVGAEKLWTRVPIDAGNVRKFTEDAGFTRCGFQSVDIGHGPVVYDLYQWRPECP